MFFTTYRYFLLWIQVWILLFQFHLLHYIQECPLRIENHAFVEAELADFCYVISQKNFWRDRVFAYFSTLWLWKFMKIDFSWNWCFLVTFFSPVAFTKFLPKIVEKREFGLTWKKKSWKWLRNRFRRNLVSRNLSQIWKNFKSQGFKSRCVVLIFENHADYWLI